MWVGSEFWSATVSRFISVCMYEQCSSLIWLITWCELCSLTCVNVFVLVDDYRRSGGYRDKYSPDRRDHRYVCMCVVFECVCIVCLSFLSLMVDVVSF